MENHKTGIGPITDSIFNNIIDKCKSNKETFMDSIAESVKQKINPYVYLGMMMYIVVIILLLIILLVIVKKR